LNRGGGSYGGSSRYHPEDCADASPPVTARSATTTSAARTLRSIPPRESAKPTEVGADPSRRSREITAEIVMPQSKRGPPWSPFASPRKGFAPRSIKRGNHERQARHSRPIGARGGLSRVGLVATNLICSDPLAGVSGASIVAVLLRDDVVPPGMLYCSGGKGRMIPRWLPRGSRLTCHPPRAT
jgi:hypothetical protein